MGHSLSTIPILLSLSITVTRLDVRLWAINLFPVPSAAAAELGTISLGVSGILSPALGLHAQLLRGPIFFHRDQHDTMHAGPAPW